MSQKVIVAAVTLAVIAYFISLEWSDADIDLETCQPDGIIAKIKRAYDPRWFWVTQHVELEFALEQQDLKSYFESCNIMHHDDQEERTVCLSWYKNRHKSMIKCLQHSTKMCRVHGGFC
jgi:hypothetical protein